MGKILIIDERAERKKNLMREKDLSKLQKYEQEGVLVMLSSFPFSGCSNEELDVAFADYNVIAIHRSLMQSENVINIIDEYFRTSKKSFIIFSGGTSVNDISNNSMRLSINASDFYSTKLIDYIERQKNEINSTSILELLYGKSWRLPLLLEYRNLLWRDGMTDEDEDRLRRAIDPSRQEPLSYDTINDEIEKEKMNFLTI